MTHREAFRETVRLLREGGIESPEYEAAILFEDRLGLSRPALSFRANEKLPEGSWERLLQDVSRRSAGEPLQYIVGTWVFMDIPLQVGPGVLIPRDDTEVCVRSCMERLREGSVRPCRIIDLCAGSGAIALAMAKAFPQAEVIALEAMPEAFAYLRENVRRSGFSNVRPFSGDLFTDHMAFALQSIDVLLSNPPYIATEELPSLPREVQREPATALDGGEDGLRFYRAIAGQWLPKLKPGGIISLEIGETQAQDVMFLLQQAGAVSLSLHRDLGDLPRCVTARMPQASSETGLSKNSSEMTI